MLAAPNGGSCAKRCDRARARETNGNYPHRSLGLARPGGALGWGGLLDGDIKAHVKCPARPHEKRISRALLTQEAARGITPPPATRRRAPHRSAPPV